MLSRHAAAALALGLALGCGPAPGGAGPSLGLREALLSSPESIAALPLEQRMSLAVQLEAAVEAQIASGRVETGPGQAPEQILLGFDEPRAIEGEDACVVLAVERDGASARVHTLEGVGPDGGAPASIPEVELVRLDPELLEEPYARALDGPAREAVQRMAAQTGSREIALGQPMPAGLLGDVEVMVVNPTWLMLLAALDEHAAVGRSAQALIEPSEHHRTDSSGFGCYGNACERSSGPCSTPTCGTCGFDCGDCACECGRDSEGIHCSTARPTPVPPSPLDAVWLVAPIAYLWFRRQR